MLSPQKNAESDSFHYCPSVGPHVKREFLETASVYFRWGPIDGRRRRRRHRHRLGDGGGGGGGTVAQSATVLDRITPPID